MNKHILLTGTIKPITGGYTRTDVFVSLVEVGEPLDARFNDGIVPLANLGVGVRGVPQHAVYALFHDLPLQTSIQPTSDQVELVELSAGERPHVAEVLGVEGVVVLYLCHLGNHARRGASQNSLHSIGAER